MEVSFPRWLFFVKLIEMISNVNISSVAWAEVTNYDERLTGYHIIILEGIMHLSDQNRKRINGKDYHEYTFKQLCEALAFYPLLKSTVKKMIVQLGEVGLLELPENHVEEDEDVFHSLPGKLLHTYLFGHAQPEEI